MVSMAAYGSLGRGHERGAQLAAERRSGWFRQLSITSLPPAPFLWARAAVIMLLVLPALLLVFAAGYVIGGVRAPCRPGWPPLGLLWLALVPLAVLGIVIGLWVKADAVQGVTTLLAAGARRARRTLVPDRDLMPPVMQTVAPALPSYWLAELGRCPFLPDAAFPWTGIVVLLAWSAGLTVLGALGYRRATATSKR